MTWAFSHCPNDQVQDDGESGCRGCPALCDQDGKPRADHCAAVFVRSDPIVRPRYGDGAPGTRGATKIVILAEAQNWRCAYCPTLMSVPMLTKGGRQADDMATIDHVIARSAGGSAIWENEVAACFQCNTHKGQFSALLFYLLMADMGFDRRAVARRLHSMTKQQRESTRRRMERRLTDRHSPAP